MSWYEQKRIRLETALVKKGVWKYFSPVVYLQYVITLPLILKNAHGDVIDLGCGKIPFRNSILPLVTKYDTLDIKPSSAEVTFIADIQDMNMIDADSYDSAICLEVLEHVPDPVKAISEIKRILKPGGVVIISVPHLSRLHDLPNDYFRFTINGISCLLEQQGFQISETKIKGGLFSFLGHQWSTIILSLFYFVPIFGIIIFEINKWLITRLCVFLDKFFDPIGYFACGYAISANKS